MSLAAEGSARSRVQGASSQDPKRRIENWIFAINSCLKLGVAKRLSGVAFGVCLRLRDDGFLIHHHYTPTMSTSVASTLFNFQAAKILVRSRTCRSLVRVMSIAV